jgi:arabinogalactan oligomer/maltooligosaccharide transport system substrate-binding protein
MKKSLSFVALSVMLVAGIASCGSTAASSSAAAASSAAATSSAAVSSAAATSSAAAASSEAVSSVASSSAIQYSTVGDGTNELSMWISAKDSKALTNLVSGFNTANPTSTVKIKYSTMEEGDVSNIYKADPTAVPDIVHLPGDAVADLVKLNYLAAYPSTVISTLNGDLDNVIDSGQDVNGNQYGLPFSANTYFMFYDKRVYTKAADLVSFDSMSAVAKAAGKQAVAFPMWDSWYEMSFFMSDGEGLFKNNNASAAETYIGDATSLQVAKAAAALYNKGSAAADGGYLLGANNDDFIAAVKTNKTCSAFVGGAWFSSWAEDGWGKENIGYAPLPALTINGTATPLKSIKDFKQICVTNNTPAKDKLLAQKFAAYMATEAGQKMRYDANGGTTMPTSDALLNDATFAAAYPYAGVFAALGKNGQFFNRPTSVKLGNWWGAAPTFFKSVQDKVEKDKAVPADSVLQGYLDTLATALLN